MLDVLEVVDSPAELPKCVCTQNEQEPGAPTRNRANWTVWFGKSDDLVSSVPAAVRGTIGSSEGVLLQAKWRLIRGSDKINNNSRSCGGSY
jgi:hypothetical protein